MLNSSIVISPLVLFCFVLFCFQGRLIKQFGELITFFCQFKSRLALTPFAILQKIRYTDKRMNLPNWMQSLDYNDISSETIALNTAFAAGIFSA